MRSGFIEGTVRILDLLCIVVAMPLALLLGELAAYAAHTRFVLPVHAGLFVVLTVLLWGSASWFFRVYESFRTRSITLELGRIAQSLGSIAVAHIALNFFLDLGGEASRPVFAAYFSIAFSLIAGSRLVLRPVARTLRRGGRNQRNFAVVGTGGLARDVVRTVSRHPEWGMQFAGHVVEDDAGAPLVTGAVLGKVSSLGEILDANVIDEVIFAVPRDRLPTVEKAVHLCQEQGAGARICLDLFDVEGAHVEVGDLDGLPLLSFIRIPSNELQLLLKRAFDVVVSAVAVLLLSPVFLATAVAIRIESPGPIFFRQTRVGQNGRLFRLLKFRSMQVDAEDRLDSLRAMNEVSGPVFKMRNDPRVTRVGHFIRRASIDELPQFLNVLAGDMSIVGPRPPIPSEVRKYERWQRRRLSVRPGITCTWQVSGRSNISFEQWMQLDLDYIDHWSLWGDLRICLRTIPAVLGSRGAH